MPNLIDPKLVKWKFFSRNVDGQIIVSDTKPEDKKAVAMLSGSTFYCTYKHETPARVKKNILRILNHEESAGLCVAVPCEDLEIMKRYYGEKLPKIEDEYVMARMHNDLCEGNEKFFPHEARFEGTMPAKEGAEQLASAIENGFDVWSYCSGGNSLAPKLELCEEYFQEHPEKIPAHKVKFVGFSNGTTMAFHLRGAVEFIFGYGVNWIFDCMEAAKKNNDEEFFKHKSEQVVSLIKSFHANEDVEITRRIVASDADNFQTARTRYQEAVRANSKITNIACWLGQMVPASIGKLPKFAANEKIIFEIEYSFVDCKGYMPDEILRRFLTSGAIDAKNILFIVLEDFVDGRDEKLPRKNGLIPNYDELRPEEQERVREIVGGDDKSKCQDYINSSNKKSQEMAESIKKVAEEFAIAIIEGGERRLSHGKYSHLAPSYLKQLEFNGDDLSIRQTCLLKHEAAIERDLIEGDRVQRKFVAKEASAKRSKSENFSTEIQTAKIIPLTAAATNFVEDSTEVIVGRSVDLAEVDAKKIAGKGVVVYLPMIKGSFSASEQFNAFQLSQNYKSAKFIILAARIPDGYVKDSEVSDQMMQNRDDNYRKLINDLGGSAPVFITRSSVNFDKDKECDFDPFSCEINLRQMLSPSENPAVVVGKKAQAEENLSQSTT